MQRNKPEHHIPQTILLINRDNWEIESLAGILSLWYFRIYRELANVITWSLDSPLKIHHLASHQSTTFFKRCWVRYSVYIIHRSGVNLWALTDQNIWGPYCSTVDPNTSSWEATDTEEIMPSYFMPKLDPEWLLQESGLVSKQCM